MNAWVSRSSPRDRGTRKETVPAFGIAVAGRTRNGQSPAPFTKTSPLRRRMLNMNARPSRRKIDLRQPDLTNKRTTSTRHVSITIPCFSIPPIRFPSFKNHSPANFFIDQKPRCRPTFAALATWCTCSTSRKPFPTKLPSYDCWYEACPKRTVNA